MIYWCVTTFGWLRIFYFDKCMVSRIQNRAGNNFNGCRVVGDNKDYLLYRFMRMLSERNKSDMEKGQDLASGSEIAEDDAADTSHYEHEKDIYNIKMT